MNELVHQARLAHPGFADDRRDLASTLSDKLLRVEELLQLGVATDEARQAPSRGGLEAGARGYILKSAMDLNLVNAIKRVAAGEMVLDPQLAKPEALKGERDFGLTPRELEVLQFIVSGMSNKEIAEKLKLSANTVSVHRANIMEALGIHKTAELVTYAIRNGLVNLP